MMKRKIPLDDLQDNVKKVKDKNPDIEKLSEYEKMVQKRKDEKISFLESLKIDEVKEDLSQSFQKLKTKRPYKKRNIPKGQVPSRKSVRTTKVDIDLSWKAVEARAYPEFEKVETKKFLPIESVEKIKIPLDDLKEIVWKVKDEKPDMKEDLNESIQKLKSERPPRTCNIQSPRQSRLAKADIDYSWKAFEERALAKAEKEVEMVAGLMQKKLRVKNIDAKPIEDLNNSDDLPPILTFEEAITGDSVYDDFVHDFDDLDFKTPEPFNHYVSCFKNMKIDKSNIAKVVADRITAMAFHPMKEKVIVVAGNKHGGIGVWNVNSDSVPYEFRPHISRVSCLKFNSDSPNQIISCSYDGTMRCGDLEKRVFNEVFNIWNESSCNYFDFISPTTTLVCHRNGNVSVVDMRSDSKPAGKSYKCHECTVKSVSVHPVNKNYFVSADVSGNLSLWDLRNLQKQPVIKVHHHKKSIISAFFSPVKGNSILTTSIDDSLTLFDCSKLGTTISLEAKVKHNNFKKTLFKATWLPNTDDAFVIGSMDFPRRIEICNSQLSNIYNFQDQYLSRITPNNVFHPSLPVLAAGNSTGKVYIFS